jgi:3-phosphoshikimate 1-carboxyvinyltransferase
MFFDLLKALGCVIRQKKRSVSLKAPKMRGAKLDLSYVPELFPFFAVLGALSRGITRITGAGEARHMKSDRIAATARALRLMGAKIVETKDGVIVKGSGKLKGAEVDGAGDYAVSAALVLAALRADGGTEIKNAGEALRRAYPSFVATLRKLGAEIRLGAR